MTVSGENLKAKDMCIKVLEFDAGNVKALLRAAKASLALHVSALRSHHITCSAKRAAASYQDYTESELCLRRVLEIEPNHAGAVSELGKLRRTEKEYQSRSREMQRNMARKLFPSAGNAATGGKATGSADKEATCSLQDDDRASATATESSDSADSSSSDVAAKEPLDSPADAPAPVAASTAIDTPIIAKKATKEPESVPAKAVQTSEEDKPVVKDDDAAAAAAAARAATAEVAASSSYSTSNIVLLLFTSLAVMVVSVYIAVFAKYQ